MSTHSINDVKGLLAQVAEGNEQAFAQLFKLHYNQLGDFIFRITESKLLTQEIVQDVFLKIWINRSSLATIESFKAYLIVVARNHAYNCLKQIAREKNRQKQWADTLLHQAVSQDNETEPGNTAEDAGRLLEEAVALLPPQQKNVYLLSRQEGISHDGIAKKLNISHGTVKKHMVLALRFLKNHLRTNSNLLILFITTSFRN